MQAYAVAHDTGIGLALASCSYIPRFYEESHATNNSGRCTIKQDEELVERVRPWEGGVGLSLQPGVSLDPPGDIVIIQATNDSSHSVLSLIGGMVLASSNVPLAGAGLLRWAVDVAAVVGVGTIVLGLKQMVTHRRQAIG